MGRRIIWGAVIVCAAFACGGDPEPPRGPAEVDALHYDYSFDLTSREATATITLVVTTAGNCFDLPVRAAGFETVTIDELPAVGRVTANLLTACGDGWEEGTEIVVSASGQVAEETVDDSQVGFSTTVDIEGNPFTYLVSWVGGCDNFGPCQSDPDRFATYTFRVSHPADTQVLCSGDLDATATLTTCDFRLAGGPTYSTFGFMASPSWTTVDLGQWGPTQVTLYDFPTANLAADIDPAAHASFIDFMEATFGPYPYGDQLRLVAGPTYWNGFEHPGNISLSERLNVINSAYADPLRHTINHELAHMWAGDQTTLAGTYDFVWKEAMAEYLTFVHLDTLDPDEALTTARAWRIFSTGSSYYPVPAEQPALFDFYGDVYGPGPMVLFRQLETIFDRDAVMTALKSLLGAERAIGVADIKAALEAATEADLTGYFDAWVYGQGTPFYPRFEVTITDIGGGEVDVTATQANPTAGLYGCAFDIRLTGANAGEASDVSFNFGVDGSDAPQTVRVAPGFAVTSHQFDPDAHTLAIEDPSTSREAPRPQLPVGFNPWKVPAR